MGVGEKRNKTGCKEPHTSSLQWSLIFPSLIFPGPPTSLPNATSCSLFLSQEKKEERKERENKRKPVKKIFKKCSHTQNGIYFVLANYSWAWGLPWSVVDRWQPIGEIDFLFIHNHLLHVVWLGWCFVSISSLWGVSANTMINWVSIHMRPGGSPVQYGSVVSVAQTSRV